MYNITNITNSSGVFDMISSVNVLVDGWLVGLFLLALFFVLLIGLKRYDFSAAITASGFSCFIISLFLGFAGLVNFMFILLFLVVAGLGAFWIHVEKR